MKKRVVCLLIIILSICLTGCTKENNNIDNNITESKQLFIDIDKDIIKSDNFDFKLDESYIVNSADD